MPADDPQLGETWRLPDPFSQKSQEAVIIGLRLGRPDSAAAVILMNRLGRQVTLAQTLFTISWRFQHPAPEKPDFACWYAGRRANCVRTAYFRVRDTTGWVRICDQHIPAGRTVLLPHDVADNRALIAEMGCPNCQAPIRAPGPDPEDGDENVRVVQCGRCGNQWVRIDIDSTDTAQPFIEHILRAAAAIGGYVQALVGFEAWTLLRPNQVASLQSIALIQNPQVGPRTIIVTSAPTLTEPRGGASMSPAVGSVWRQIRGDRLASVIAVDVDPASGGGRVTFQLTDQTDPTSLPIREFVTRFTTSPRHEVDVVGPPDRRARPVLGDTWWSRKTRRPVLVLSVGFDEIGNDIVRFQSDVELTLVLPMFLDQFQVEPPTPECRIGEEWNNGQPNTLTVTDIDMERRQVHGVRLGVPEVVPLAAFVLSFSRVVRKTVYDLLED